MSDKLNVDEVTTLWEKNVETIAGQPTRFVLVSLSVSCLNPDVQGMKYFNICV